MCVGRDYGGIYPNLLFLLCHGSTLFFFLLAKARLALVFALRSVAGLGTVLLDAIVFS